MKTTLLTLLFGIISVIASAQWQSNQLDSIEVTGLSVADTRLFVGTIAGMHVSDDFGDHFNYQPISPFCPVYQLAPNGNTLFAAISNGLRRSLNNGTTWSAINALINFTVYSVLVHGSKVYAASRLGVHLSSDNGAQWTSVSAGLPELEPTTFITACGSDLFVLSDSSIFRSVNAGVLWVPADTGINSLKVFSLLSSGSTLFAGTENGVFRSIDQGSSWTASGNGMPVTTVRSLCHAGIHVFAATDDGIFYSGNNGTDWVNITENLPANKTQFVNICGARLFVAMTDMQTGGELWSRPLLQITGNDDLLSDNSLHVYPNPAQGALFLKTNGHMIDEALLIDIQGKQIKLAHSQSQINLQGITPGQYILRLRSAERYNSRWISVQ